MLKMSSTVQKIRGLTGRCCDGQRPRCYPKNKLFCQNSIYSSIYSWYCAATIVSRLHIRRLALSRELFRGPVRILIPSQLDVSAAGRRLSINDLPAAFKQNLYELWIGGETNRRQMLWKSKPGDGKRSYGDHHCLAPQCEARFSASS